MTLNDLRCLPLTSSQGHSRIEALLIVPVRWKLAFGSNTYHQGGIRGLRRLRLNVACDAQLWTKDGSRGWSLAAAGSLQGESGTLPQLFLDFHGQGRHYKLIDFDDHLNDIKRYVGQRFGACLCR